MKPAKYLYGSASRIVGFNFFLFILGVKSWQINDAAVAIEPFLSENTLVLPLQNVVNNVEKLIAVIDKKHVLVGACRIYSKVEDDGVINHFGFASELLMRELTNEKSQKILRIKSIFDQANFATTVPDDMHTELWKKFMFICTVSGLGALTRVSICKMYKHEETQNFIKKTSEDIYTLATAKNISLPPDIVGLIMGFIKNQPYESAASTQRDIISGRPSELEDLNGYIVREAEKLNVNTPVNNFIYNSLYVQESQARNNG